MLRADNRVIDPVLDFPTLLARRGRDYTRRGDRMENQGNVLNQLTVQQMARLRGRTVAVSTSEADAPATRDRSPLHQRELVA